MCTIETTVITVNYCRSGILNQNLLLTSKLNKKCTFEWIVTENTPLDEQVLEPTLSEGFRVIQGVDKPSQYYAPASYHHGLGLNKALEFVRTRYLLVLDPDFFITRKEALYEMIMYMKERNISLLGVPWHPRNSSKYRDFPCLHCLMIDTFKIEKSSIDFRPIYEKGRFHDLNSLPIFRLRPSRLRVIRCLTFLNSILLRLGLDILKLDSRMAIGRSMDTGARLYMRYYPDNTVSREALRPIKHKSQCMRSDKASLFIDKCIDILMPGFFKLDAGVYSRDKTKFPSLGAEIAPEEFSWGDKYFGFHLRLFPKKECDLEVISSQLREWLKYS
jgi:hypothetical protein